MLGSVFLQMPFLDKQRFDTSLMPLDSSVKFGIANGEKMGESNSIQNCENLDSLIQCVIVG